jgi:hypothetical protein
MQGHYTTSPSNFKHRSPVRRLPYAPITPWHIHYLSNAERLVSEGIFCELAIGEASVCTSADIARWANVSEATVSRALPELAAKGLITLTRVTYRETGRTRWKISRCAPQADGSYRRNLRQADGSYVPADEGSDMDGSAAVAHGRSDMDGSVTADEHPASAPKTHVLPAATPHTIQDQDSASERLTSMSDPGVFYDSDHAPNKHASMPDADAEKSQPNQSAPISSETPTVPFAFTELTQRGVIPYSASKILHYFPDMTGATFDQLLERVCKERKASKPLRYLCGILQRGETLDPLPTQREPDALPRSKISNLPILLARVDAAAKMRWCKLFELCRTEDERQNLLDRFAREALAKEDTDGA